MYSKYFIAAILLVLGCLMLMPFQSCSNRKNTSLTRTYHAVNTRYNVHFNANEAYKESMKQKEKQQEKDDNLSQFLYIYPEIIDSTDLKSKGAFTTTIDKTTKAIKLHSIKTRPRKDPNKRGDQKYQEWTKQKEFNPFLVNTWMLLGKAEFEEGSYLRAITTFMYITKIYPANKRVVSESKLWIARAYSEMGWRYEAENVLRKMEQNEEIHHELLGMYVAIKANLYVRNKEYKNAIPHLEEAIEHEKSSSQKRRQKFLLGQLYEVTGDNEKAFKAYGSVRGLNAPYQYIISSKLKQIEVASIPDNQRIKDLKKMTRGSKNEEYLDKVYTALGNVYLNTQDTIRAIENYALAVEKSKKNGYEKALAQIKLGGLHFDRKEYIQAQPHYSGALPQLRKTDEYFPLVSLRSEVLDQLVVHAKAVHEQDSLLHLASMPEDERNDFLTNYISELRKEDEKRAKEAELEERRDQYGQSQQIGWDDLNKQTTPTPSTQSGFGKDQVADFYFYNPTAVEQGKLAFQKKWGKRSLEDNWRRRNKEQSNFFGEEESEVLAEEQEITEDKPGDETKEDKKELVTDKYSVEYYLQQLPLTDEAKAESYKMIEDGLFNMGLIYKNLLEDNELALDAFQISLQRFPSNSHKEEIYYQLFLIYLQTGNEPLMAMYRNLIISEFPESKYAIPLSDENYAWNFKYIAKVQEELYQETYQAYLDANVAKVRKDYETIQQKFPFVSLMPKFAFLNALTYAQTKDANQLEKHLMKLVADYPEADVTPMATNILKNIKDGMILLSDGSPIVSMDWTMAYANDSIFEGENAKVLAYLTDLDKPYTLQLMFKPGSIDRNDLLYEVADYNFSNYVVQTYDLKFDENPILSSLEISGFDSFKAIKSYLIKALDEQGLITKIDKAITPVPISADNHATIYPRLGLADYMTFYRDSLGIETPQLLAYWGMQDDWLLAKAEEVEQSMGAVEPEKKEEESAPLTIAPETGEEKITISQLVTIQKEKEKKVSDKEINLEDILSEDQVQGIGNIFKKRDDGVDAIQEAINNPVEGLKNIFNRNKLEENLTKEEKEELKKQQKEEKEKQKELARIWKKQKDSIARAEKYRADSILQIERAIQDSIQTANRLHKEQLEQEKKDRERKQKEEEQVRIQEIKDKEEARKQQVKEREERRRQQERERQETQKQRERERDQMLKQREEERKQKEKEAEVQRKQREQERQQLLKEQEKQRGR